MGTGELHTHVLLQAAARVTQDSSINTGCATDMVLCAMTKT